MEQFTEVTRRWFEAAFAGPTEVQRQGWERIAAGDHTLLIAPTGSGKTLAAFLYAIDQLTRLPADAPAGVRVVYVSPLKALAYDIDRNLRVPLAGIRRSAGLDDRPPEGAVAPPDTIVAPASPVSPASIVIPAKTGTVRSEASSRSVVQKPGGTAAGSQRSTLSGNPAPLRLPRVDVRTGDTPHEDRRRQAKDPAEILVTTPESLFLILGSGARETLRTVRWVIVDEVHAVAATKRGAHLSLSLERLAAVADQTVQRIGLSATARPASEVARFLGGDRPVSIVDTHKPPALDLQVVVTVDDMTRPVVETEDGGFEVLDADQPGSGSLMLADHDEATRTYGIWPAVYPKIVELIKAHRSTIVFVNSRGLCERLAQRLNELAGEELVRAHHGSVSQQQRREIEEALKAGQLPAIVATSSLELGIDMGAVDLVILVESPGAVSRGLQRVGRAGHGVGETSIGRIFPKHRGDLLEATIVAKRMREGAIEALRVPRNPLDVLAQHIVAMVAAEDWKVSDLAHVVRRSACFHALPDDALRGVLDMLSGLYPSHDFADLRPRLLWDREQDLLQGRRSSRMLAAVNAGTIPDRGMYSVYLGDEGPRIGELDEEMVHEISAGQTFTLGATTWRIERINRNRVVVSHAPGESGRLPFWKGEGPGRPLELGVALGTMIRTFAGLDRADAERLLQSDYGLDERAARNLLDYLDEQRDVTGTLPTDREITVERFRDELGDWRVCILTPFGARVHAPWALALRSIVSERTGYDVQTVWSDDGIVLTIADGDEPPDAALLVPDADELEDRLLLELPRSPIFAAEFRENAARALLLPRRRPGQRTPLFAQRLRAQQLMEIALQYPSFPIVVETFRSCMQDVFDVPALRDVLRAVESGETRIHEVETASASPFARSLVFAYVAAYLYEGDSPAAERRAQALSVDVKLLRELLGEADLRDLLDAEIIAQVEAQLQRTAEGRRARHADDLHDMLRQLGDLTEAEIAERVEYPGRGGAAGAGGQDGRDSRTSTSASTSTSTRTSTNPGTIPNPGKSTRTTTSTSTNPGTGTSIRTSTNAIAETGAGGDGGEGADQPVVDPAAVAAAREMLGELRKSRRAMLVRVGRRDAWIAVEDVALYRDALGTAPPSGIPSVYLDPVEQPVDALLMRWARTHGPFTTATVAARYAVVPSQAQALLERMAADGRLLHGEFTPGATGPEWCEPDVLRQIKRRTIAMLRGQVAPVSREVLGRFLPVWHHLAAVEPRVRLEDAIAQLEGLPLSYRDLTRLILPSRVRSFRPEQLDELGALGWLVWTGHSPLRGDDGRIVLYTRERVNRLLIPPDEEQAITTIESFDGRHQAILDRLARRGASFHPELVAAVSGVEPGAVTEAIWDLVWAGLVTNDTFSALRRLGARPKGSGRARPQRPGSVRLSDATAADRSAADSRESADPADSTVSGGRRPRRLPRGWWRGDQGGRGGGAIGGRWSLVRDLLYEDVTSTERAHAWAATLLERHGVVARESAQIEALGGGLGNVYSVLRSMEDAGKLRRGYFIEGLGGSQFAYPAIIDRLRRERDAAPQESAVALAATDPANPYGWLLPWPPLAGDENGRGARRAAGNVVVLLNGSPVLFVDRDGKRLRLFADVSESQIGRAVSGLVEVARARPSRTLSIEKIGSDPAIRSPLTQLLTDAGFRAEYRSLKLSVK